MSRKKPKFVYEGGAIALPKNMIRSPAFRSLSPAARALVIELQMLYAPGRIINYGCRQAGEALGMSGATGSRALNELIEGGFIELVGESNFYGRLARSFYLTWLPRANGREPLNLWQQKSTVSPVKRKAG